MVFQVDFNALYYDITRRFKNAFVAYDCYGLFLQSDGFTVSKVEAFLSYFGLKNLLVTFSERDFSASKLLNH